MADKTIHVGFPKTGTTYLQKNIYPYLSGVRYFDYKVSDQLFYDLIFLDHLDYDVEKNKNLFAKYLNDESVLFSFESLAGAPFIYKGANRSHIPLRLKEIGFNKVILTLRNQTDMVDSMYRQYVVQGGVMKFKDFLDLEENWKLSIRPFYLGYLEYHKLVEIYYKVFGNENVLVLLQEDLKKNHHMIVQRIESFTGSAYNKPIKLLTKNESLSNLSISLLRICNHFIFTSQKPNNLISNKISTWFVRRVFAVILDPYFFRFFSSKKSYLTSEQKFVVSKRYQKSNMELQKLIGVELNEFYLNDS